MNWFEKHLGDWAKKTGHLSMLEEGAYNRLVDWCYAHEKPLPLEMREVCKCARATCPPERKAVQKVLHEFFELTESGWRKDRIERTIAAVQQSRPLTQQMRLQANERKARSRERRRLMFDALREAGLAPSWNATNRDLYQMFEEHGVTVPVTTPVTRDRSLNGHDSHPPLSQYPSAPVTGHKVPDHASADVTDAVTGAATASRAGEACKAMKRAGLSPETLNPSHPQLLRLLEGGVTDAELATVAAEASARHKGFAWVLATVDGRRRDAAAMGPVGPANDRQSAAAARMQEWAPLAVKRNSGGA